MPVQFRFSSGKGALTFDMTLEEARDQVLAAMRDAGLIQATDVAGQRHVINPHYVVELAEIDSSGPHSTVLSG
jgi:hypothetical protein